MLREMPSQQFFEWFQFDSMSPIGGIRSDLQTASIVQAIVNMNRDSKRHPTPFPLKNFLLEYKTKEVADQPQERKQTVEDQVAVAKLWVAISNAMAGAPAA